MRLELERRGDPEVAAAAAQAPEQFGLGVRADLEHVTVGGDELDRRQVVDRHAEAAHQPPDPTAQRQPGDTGRRDHAAGRRQAVLVRHPVVLVPRRTALHPGPPPGRVDVAAPHRCQIDHHAALGDGLAGDAVPATASRDLEPLRAGEAHRVHDVGRVGAPGDKRRSLVDVTIVNGPHRVVASVIRPDELPGELGTEPLDRSPRQRKTHDSLPRPRTGPPGGRCRPYASGGGEGNRACLGTGDVVQATYRRRVAVAGRSRMDRRPRSWLGAPQAALTGFELSFGAR